MQSKLLCVAVLLVLATMAARPKWTDLNGYTYERYLKDFGKTYQTSEEYLLRKSIFENRLQEIFQHNSVRGRTWHKGVNHMSDWTEAERKRLLGTPLRDATKSKSQPLRVHAKSTAGLPNSVDWRLADPPILTSIKDQGMCGSCWAHSATEAVETAYAQKTGELFVLSQEQITACTPNPNQCGGTGGCGGNIYEDAWDYVVAAGGLSQEWSWSYTSYTGTTGVCPTFPIPNSNRTFMPVVQISGYVHVETNSQDAVMDALANVGPLSISLDASQWGDYEGGVFTGCNFADNITIDHGVQLVGYGHDYSLGMDYWIVRNSWSPAWGEQGYIRLHRQRQSYCGWNNDNDYQGIGCNAGPNPSPNNTWVCGMCGLAVDAAYVVVP